MKRYDHKGFKGLRLDQRLQRRFSSNAPRKGAGGMRKQDFLDQVKSLCLLLQNSENFFGGKLVCECSNTTSWFSNPACKFRRSKKQVSFICDYLTYQWEKLCQLDQWFPTWGVPKSPREIVKTQTRAWSQMSDSMSGSGLSIYTCSKFPGDAVLLWAPHIEKCWPRQVTQGPRLLNLSPILESCLSLS